MDDSARRAGSQHGCWENHVREWTRPGSTHLAICPRVGCEPRGDGVQSDSPTLVHFQSCGHSRLSSRTFWGVIRRQGQGISHRDPHRLDPDGWLVRSEIDTKSNESPAAQNDRKVNNQLSRQTSGSDSAPGKLSLLDTRLLMGGTHPSTLYCRPRRRDSSGVTADHAQVLPDSKPSAKTTSAHAEAA